jgi:hypothetical protein
MTTESTTDKRPLWLLIEDKILGLTSDDLSPGNLEQTIQRTAAALDETGINISQNAGNMLQLRWAVDARIKVGRPMLEDFNGAISALKLENVTDAYTAAVNIIANVGESWPKLKESGRRADVLRIVEKTKLDLLIVRAKELGGEQGIRFLLENDVASGVIVEVMGVSEEEVALVNAAVEAERAERARVISLIEATGDKSDEEKVKDLINNNVADDLILELAGVAENTLSDVKKSMEEEIKDKQRLVEEAAAKKKAEAEGPPLEDIPPDQMLEYIESIREILEFSDAEKEIRAMCEQSAIPKSLIDIAVSDAGKLDELESQAEAG